MPARALLVEARVRVVLVYLDALKRFAILTDESIHPSRSESPHAFALWVARIADAATSHVVAIGIVLQASCTNLDAPAGPGGVR